MGEFDLTGEETFHVRRPEGDVGADTFPTTTAAVAALGGGGDHSTHTTPLAGGEHALLADGYATVQEIADLGGSPVYTSGAGTPIGTVDASPGTAYIDTTNAVLYFNILGGVDGWVCVTGVPSAVIPGFYLAPGPGGNLTIVGPPGAQVYITDPDADAGSGNGLFWTGSTPDGQQAMKVQTGDGEVLIGVIQDQVGRMKVPRGIAAAHQNPNAPANPRFEVDDATGDAVFTPRLAESPNGPIVKDQSDGHTYRIICTNGVLSTQLVT